LSRDGAYAVFDSNFDAYPSPFYTDAFLVNLGTPGQTMGPIISNVSLTDVTSSGATVHFETSKAASSQVEYGTTAFYAGGITAFETSLNTTHMITVDRLEPGRLYHFRIKVCDDAGNIVRSNDLTFTTEGQGVLHAENVVWTNLVNCAVTFNSLMKSGGNSDALN